MAFLQKLLRDKKGNVMLISAAAMPLLIGATGMAVDVVQLSLSRSQLQRSADSASLAGAYAIVQNKSVNTSVNRALTLNNPSNLTVSSTIENAPTAGSFAGNNLAVRVILSATQKTPFMTFITRQQTTVQVEATAAAVVLGRFCVISLETGNVTGVNFAGSADVNLGCGVAANSRAAQAIMAGGSSSVRATPLLAVGGIPSSGNYIGATTILPYSPPQQDPYSGLPTPNVPSPCAAELSLNPQQTASPTLPASGVLCYRGMDIKGTLNLPTGAIVYIDGTNGGFLKFGSQATVNGTNVTFILTSSTAASDPSSVATVNINGGATLNLTPPNSGTYSGILMYQDRRAALGVVNQITGNSSSYVEGAFYFPRQDLSYIGNTGLRTHCIQLVSRRISFSGNSSISNVCPADSGAHAYDGNLIRLVA